MLLGARQFFTTKSGNAEEEMYKELLTQILSNTLPADSVLDITLPDIRKWAFGSQSNLKTLIIRGVTALTGRSEYFVQGSNVETVELPDLLSCNHFVFWSTPTIKVLRVPKLKTNMTSLCYIGTSALTDVYIDESTCAEIMAIPGFPGMTTSQNSNYANIVFHGSDGTISYDGSAWVITA